MLAPGGLTIEPLATGGGRASASVHPDTLTLAAGSLTFVDSRLQFDIAGVGAGQFDVLHLLGNANFIGGTLELSFAGGYLPAQGDHWQLLVGGLESTGLATLQPLYEGLPAGYAFAVRLSDGGIEVTVTQTAAVPEPAAMLLACSNFFSF